VLNVDALERGRWAATANRGRHNAWSLAAMLLIANAIAGNLWLGQMSGLRADLTGGHIHPISKATRNYLSQLREPLLIRGHFSARTHPLLAPKTRRTLSPAMDSACRSGLAGVTTSG